MSADKAQVVAPSQLAVLFGQLKPWQGRLLLLSLSAAVALALPVVFPSASHTLEETLGTSGWTLSPVVIPEERINIVAIDDKSLQEVGAWPWPRSTMAKLSQKLKEAGSQLQLYDIYFPEVAAGDEELVSALRDGNAVLPQVPDLRQLPEQVRSGQLDHAAIGVNCNAFTQTSNYVGNASAFADIPKGHIAPWVENDGAIRQVPALVCVDGKAYPMLALSALQQALGTNTSAISIKAGRGLLDAEQELSLDAYPGLRLPLDGHGNLRVSFANAPETFTSISASDVLAGRIDPSVLANRWALVGFTASGLIDIVPTPYNGAAPGVEIQARILASVLDDRVPYTPRAAALLLMLMSGVFAALLWSLASAREKLASYGLTIFAGLLPAIALGLHAQLLASHQIWLGWLSPALFGFFSASALLLHEFARVKLERSRVLVNLSSYLPAEVASEIAYSLPNSSINAHRKNVTLLSADLRNFSAYGEARPPEESAALLHFFFTKTTEIIEKFHGRVHEFKGDSLLAMWDGSDAITAQNALNAALEMQQSIENVLPQNPPAGLEPLALGIGIEQGPVLVGSIGPAHRRSHTLLGETVTITLRIQEMTADLANPILVGECAARQLAEQGLISQGSYLLAGLRNPHILYAPPIHDDAPSSARNEAPPLRVLRGGRT